MNNLATIQRVTNVRPCPNSDKLDLVQILGWQVVTKRDEFRENDLCVYITIDTLLPDRPEFEFLRNKNFRIKPIRLRGQESAGIVFPLSILDAFEYNLPIEEGNVVTDCLKIIKYEKPMPAELQGIAVGGLPGFLIMTDEDNLRSYPDAIPEMYSRPYYITRKDDGSSGTFFIKNGEFGVCSRKIHLKESENNGFWRIAKKYDIESILRREFPDDDIALQGEVVGPSIQGNKLGLKEMEFHFFNLFKITQRYYLDYDKLINFGKQSNIPMVTLLEEGSTFSMNLAELIAFANKQLYPNGSAAEGIVIRPKESFTSSFLKKSWSGKIINENFKEKE